MRKLHKLVFIKTGLRCSGGSDTGKKISLQSSGTSYFFYSPAIPKYYMRSRICSTHVLFNISVPYSPSLKRLIGLVSGYDSDEKKKKRAFLLFSPSTLLCLKAAWAKPPTPPPPPPPPQSTQKTAHKFPALISEVVPVVGKRKCSVIFFFFFFALRFFTLACQRSSC